VLVLSHLACASLKEDRYGVVQRDLAKILEALLSFLGALEDYRAEIVETCPSHEDIAASTGKEQEDKLRTLQEITQAVEPLDQLQDGMSFIWRVVVYTLLSLSVASSEEWCGGDCWNVRRDVVGFQVPSKDSEEVAGIHGCENELGLITCPRRLSYCWIISISFQAVCILLQLREM